MVDKILVIDDNDTDLLIAKIVIERTGFKGNLITKTSAKSALEHLNSLSNNPENWPNAIFLDINMPLVSGYGFIEEFEKFNPDLIAKTNIIILTSSDNKTDFEAFQSKPFVKDYMPKPISPDAFLATLEKIK